ncbi:MAG: calcium-binding protein [Alphaproteobacteria bacterium]|nr:MAG: calcium-binding protein [Alphaproteobacteria bacterium]
MPAPATQRPTSCFLHIKYCTTIFHSHGADMPSSPANDDEPTGNTDTDIVLTLGDDHIASLQSDDDQDAFRVSLDAGSLYRIYIYAPAAIYAPELVTILDENGDTISPDIGRFGRSYFAEYYYTPETTGDFFMVVGGELFSGDDEAAYQITVSEVVDDEPAGSTETAISVTVDGDSFHGAIDYFGDTDFVAVELEAGKMYLLSGFSYGLDSLVARGVYDADGTQMDDVPGSVGSGLYPIEIYYAPQESGTYYVQMAEESDTLTGSYFFSVKEIDDDDPWASTETALSVEIGSGTAASYDYETDTDMFAADLEAGQHYVFYFTSDTTRPYVADLFDQDGNEITDQAVAVSSWGSAGNPYVSGISFTPTEDGTYYFTGASYGVNPYDYVAHVDAIEDDEPYGTSDSTATLSVGTSLTGTFEIFGDHDTYATTLRAGVQYRFDLDGITAGTTSITSIIDANGNVVSSGGYGPQFYTAEENGTYYITVREGGTSSPSPGQQLGTYSLSVNSVTDDEDGDVLVLDEPYSGSIDFPGDIDELTFEVTAGSLYSVVFTSEGSNSVNASIHYEGGDSVITTHIYHSDYVTTEYTFGVQQDGLINFGLSRYSSSVGGYTVEISLLDDDEPNGLGQTTWSLGVGETLEGTLEAKLDEDYIAVYLEAGTVYEAHAERTDSDSVPYLTFALMDADGGEIEALYQSTEHNESTSYYMVQETGTYYLEVGGNYFHWAGDYAVSLDSLTDDEPTGGTDTAAYIARGGSHDGTIDYTADHDVVAADLVGGIRYDIELVSDGYYTVRLADILDSDSDSQEYSYTVDQDGNAVYSITATEGGTYYFDIWAEDYTGAYQVALVQSYNLNGTSRSEQLQGSNDDEIITGLYGQDTLLGFGGDDTLLGGSGYDVLKGGDGNDLLNGGSGVDTLDGGDGNDTASYDTASYGVIASLGDEGGTYGDAYGDLFVSVENLTGSRYNDRLEGDQYDNILTGGEGADTLYGSAGSDTASYTNSSAGVSANLVSGLGSGGDANGDKYIAIENLTGSRYGDSLIGNRSANVLAGGAGDDTLVAGYGYDSLSGGDGDDYLKGGYGIDTLEGGAGADTLDGEQDNDWVSYAGSDEGVSLTLLGNGWATGSGGDAEGDRVANVQRITGSEHNDSLGGNSGNNWIIGGDGDDLLEGGVGVDTLEGGLGNDTIRGNYTADSLSGGDGADGVFGGYGNDTLDGGDGDDTLLGERDMDLIHGGNGDDLIGGGTEADTLYGDAGNDTIRASEGNDLVYGGDGDDSIEGGNGRDTITGGAGDDWLSGGGEPDTFIFADGDGNDTISDFQVGRDTLDLSDTEIDFTSLDDLIAHASTTTIDGVAGLLIETGDGDSIFLQGLNTNHLTGIDVGY